MTDSTDFVKLTRNDIERLFLPLPRQVMIPSPEGRFLLHVQNLDDGKGPIHTPNVKHLTIDMEGGREGNVELVRCESEPQQVKTDGSHVIVINKIDKHVALALGSKFADLEQEHGGRTRQAIEKFLTYVRGFEFDPSTGKAKLAISRAGFNPDIYFQLLEVAQKLHYDPKDRASDLRDQGNTLSVARYVKKPIATTGVFIDSPIEYYNQQFKHGALLQLSSPGKDGRRSISFIDPSDILDCYTWINGDPLVDEHKKILLPHYKINQNHEIEALTNTQILTPDDVKSLDTIHVQTQSSRVYVKPDARFFDGKDEITFQNEADHVIQKLDAKDGVLICAFNYRKKNDDYQLKADKFLHGIQDAHASAKDFDELIKKISALYRDLDIGTPDIYTSTREKMKLQNLEGVKDEVIVKHGDAELLRIVTPGDVTKFERTSDHRDAQQTYTGEAFIQITDRGTKYEKFRGVQSQFAASAYEAKDGRQLLLHDVPSYTMEYAKGPEGMAAGTGQTKTFELKRQVE